MKSFILIPLAFVLSFTILGPAFLALLENNIDIELVQDFEEDAKNESKKELEDEKFFEEDFLPSFETTKSLDLATHFYLLKVYGHIPEINSPPPEHI